MSQMNLSTTINNSVKIWFLMGLWNAGKQVCASFFILLPLSLVCSGIFLENAGVVSRLPVYKPLLLEAHFEDTSHAVKTF